MADASQLQLNPYALFDPSQWSNPYSRFQNQALPGASYAGWPTDAMGNPIQAPQGMTINQTPAQPAAAPAPAATRDDVISRLMSQGIQEAGRVAAANAGIGYNNALAAGRGQTAASGDNIAAQEMAMQDLLGQQRAQPAAQPVVAAPPANSAGLTPQQYMQLRANPGPVPTYGATVPQASPGAAPGAGVLQQFLQNWKPAQSGPGSGFQQGFAAALKNKGY